MENKKYFYGNEVSEYGVKNGYVDYGTLAKVGDCVLCNDITKLFFSTINDEYNEVVVVSGCDYDEENDYYYDIFQYFIVSRNMVDALKKANEIVYYIETLDMYVWGVTHFGTSWDYVLTDIEL